MKPFESAASGERPICWIDDCNNCRSPSPAAIHGVEASIAADADCGTPTLPPIGELDMRQFLGRNNPNEWSYRYKMDERAVAWNECPPTNICRPYGLAIHHHRAGSVFFAFVQEQAIKSEDHRGTFPSPKVPAAFSWRGRPLLYTFPSLSSLLNNT